MPRKLKEYNWKIQKCFYPRLRSLKKLVEVSRTDTDYTRKGVLIGRNVWLDPRYSISKSLSISNVKITGDRGIKINDFYIRLNVWPRGRIKAMSRRDREKLTRILDLCDNFKGNTKELRETLENTLRI